MREIECPKYSALTVFEECLGVKRDKNLKARFQCVTGIITGAETTYKEKAKTLSFHEIGMAEGVGTCVSTAEMEDLYETVFARKSSPVRNKYYDKLMLAPDNGICPLCGQRDASTLDHYLPKAKNPSLAVTPINLVPACKECNHTKSKHHPEIDDQQLIHPYYDSLPKSIWLVADLEHSKPPALRYSVSTAEECDEVLAKRLAWHFEKFGLAKLYASQSGSTLSGIAEKLKSAWMRGGKEEVRFVLNEDALSWSKHNQNSWQAVMYRTLANSDWFCGEGYAYAGEKRKVG